MKYSSIMCSFFLFLPLHADIWEALYNHNLQALKEELGKGEDPNIIKSCISPLGQAALYNNIEMMNLLFDHGALVKPTSCFSPLYLAIDNNATTETLDWLFDHGASVDDNDPLQQGKPLHWAALKGDCEIINYLVKNKNAPVDHTNGYEITPLQCACEKGNIEAIRTLLSLGADPLLEDDAGKNASAFVKETNSNAKAILQLLEENRHAPLFYGAVPGSPKAH